MTDSPARILYVSPISTLAGGETITLFDLMSNLDRDRFQPHLVCPEPGSLPDLCRKHGIETVFVPSIPPSGGRARNNLFYLIPDVNALYGIINRFHIDLVHANTARVAYHSGLAARLKAIPHITHVHEIYNLPFRSKMKAWFLNQVSDRILVESNATRHIIISQQSSLARKTEVVYPGLEPMPSYTQDQVLNLRAEFGMDDRFPLLAVVGAILPLKGQEIVIRALPGIIERYPHTRCLLVGSPLGKVGEEYQAHLIELARQLGVTDHLVLTGFRKDVTLIMASIDMLLHTPILPDALPHVLLEASHYKALIVASDIGGISEIVKDGINGCLVPPEQPDILAQAVRMILDNPTQASKMRIAAGENMENQFSMAKYINHVQAIYQELLEC